MSDKDVDFGDTPDETLIEGKNDSILISDFEKAGDVDIRVTDTRAEYEEIEGKGFGESADEMLMGEENISTLSEKAGKEGDGLELYGDIEVTDVQNENEKMEGKGGGESADETLIGEENISNLSEKAGKEGDGLELYSDIEVIDVQKDCEGKIEGKAGGESADETLIGEENISNLCEKVEKTGDDVVGDGLELYTDTEVMDIQSEYEKNEGKGFGESVDETLIGDDNVSNLSKEFDKTGDVVGDGFESKTEVRATETYSESEKVEVEEIAAAMDEDLIDDNNGGVVLESNKDNNEEEEEDTRFGVSDLVWGKVRSHPWWPGQIFDPADASKEANKYSKKDGYLIAYFGDQTFAWNEEAKIKPFSEHFVSMERQSKTDSFCHAVDCALGEVSRRVELGLACKCLSNEVYDKIKTQRVVNAGIREESSKREGGDVNGDFSVESFEPLDLVRYVKGLGESLCGGTDMLGFVTARAQLLAFNRHKGFYNLPEFQVFGGFLGNGLTENNGDVSLAKEMGIKDGSKKRKKISRDFVSPSKKERKMLESHTSSSGRKRKSKADTYATDSMMVEEKKDSSLSVTPKQFSVGKRICSVISALKDERNGGSVISSPKDGGNGGILSSGKKRGRKKFIKAEEVSSDEILSHLCAVARDPIKGYSSLGSIISFLSDMKNMFSLEKSEKERSSESTEEEELTKEETMTDAVVEGFEDSYWTDRFVISDIQEQVLFEPETQNENALNPDILSENPINPETLSENPIIPETLNGNAINVVTCAESEPKEETGTNVNEKGDEECNPTALILNFSDIDSVPSQQNLNNIFRRYGPLNETGTEVMKKSKRAKVIFKRRSDAETAFSSSGKFSIFGPSLVSYRLHYLPNKPDQGSPAKKRSKKAAKSLEDNDG